PWLLLILIVIFSIYYIEIISGITLLGTWHSDFTPGLTKPFLYHLILMLMYLFYGIFSLIFIYCTIEEPIRSIFNKEKSQK
ncbi:MAG: hypothetical protein ABH950_08060, partial [Candidatus Altiarchaeota archaeon]